MINNDDKDNADPLKDIGVLTINKILYIYMYILCIGWPR